MRAEASAPRSRAALQFRGIVQLRGLTSAAPRTIPLQSEPPASRTRNGRSSWLSYSRIKHGSDRTPRERRRTAYGRSRPARNDERIPLEGDDASKTDHVAFMGLRCARARGGDGGARTRHLRSARPTLSQLSYVPSGMNVDDVRGSTVERTMVTRAGLEPAPPGLQPSARTRYATESRTTRRRRRRRTRRGVIGGIEPAPTRVTTERTDHRTTTEAATSGGSPQRDGSRARRPRSARETRTS